MGPDSDILPLYKPLLQPEDMVEPSRLYLDDRVIRNADHPRSRPEYPEYELSQSLESLKEDDNELKIKWLVYTIGNASETPTVQTEEKWLYHIRQLDTLTTPTPAFRFHAEPKIAESHNVPPQTAGEFGMQPMVQRQGVGQDHTASHDYEFLLSEKKDRELVAGRKIIVGAKVDDSVRIVWGIEDNLICAHEFIKDRKPGLKILLEMSRKGRNTLVTAWVISLWEARHPQALREASQAKLKEAFEVRKQK